ncbi:MAG: DEAD/DEAH box helicase, partial [Methyloprofundus sp.]|nr:DEAD/DEAH box helicase [Methyloprofundus sp.]
MDSKQQVADFFAANGALAKIIPDYLPRVAQVEMAAAVAQSIEAKEHVIVEAGTGTGKTFAYLVPAIVSGKKVIVSTGTKNLQDQLFNKDVPLIRKAMKAPFAAALLKGRANYLCTYRLELAVHSNLGFSREEISALAKIKKWSKSTRTGDTADMHEVMETNPIWQQATSTRENCLGQECPAYAECFLMKARKKAQEAHLIVVNHHLLCADWSIRETGFGELLPNADVVIIDEAHQLADTASNFLGISLGSKQISELANDALMEFHQGAKDMPDLRVASENLTHEMKDMRLAFGMDMKRGDWKEIEANPKVMQGLTRLQEHLEALADQLELASVRSKGLEACFKRAEELEEQFNSILQDNSGKWVRWYETHKKSFSLHLTPLDVATEFQAFMKKHSASWVFTSATLSVAQKFDYFAANLGISNAKSHSWESPFDFPNQSLFYHPKGLPQPNAPDFVEQIVEVAIPVINASKGRTFFLFTSHRALQAAAKILDKRIQYPILVQGDKPKAVLLDDFKKKGNAVLLGTSSFWEGIDVRGEALSTVIIDKLPFSSPGDPVLKARLEA